jgi:hypothetical protein
MVSLQGGCSHFISILSVSPARIQVALQKNQAIEEKTLFAET